MVDFIDIRVKRMSKNRIYILVLILVTLLGCRKDEVTETSSGPIIPDPTVAYISSVSGVVTDDLGQSIEDAVISYDEITARTDRNGHFKLSNVEVSEEGSLIKVSKEGFYHGFSFAHTEGSEGAYLNFRLVKRTKTSSFNSNIESLVVLDGGANISFQADGIVTENETPYNGVVNVFAHWYNPTSSSLGSIMPGDLRAINSENQLRQLVTYGMLVVELESESGEPLQLKQGKTAEISLPVPEDLVTSAPDKLPLWHFDEASGYWIEEGEARLVGDNYVGEVSHFSFWNCDAPFPVVEFIGRLVDQNGQALSRFNVCLLINESGITRDGYTNNAGYFKGKVPKDEEMLLTVKDICGETVFSKPIGPFSSETDIGDLVVDLAEYGHLISAQLIDCDGNFLPDAYLLLSSEGSTQQTLILEADENGRVETLIASCEDYTLTTYAYDPESLVQSDIQVFEDLSGPIDLGVIELCENLDEYINITIDGVPQPLFSEPDAILLDGQTLIFDAYQIIDGQILSFNSYLDNPDPSNVQIPKSILGRGIINNASRHYFCNAPGASNSCDQFQMTLSSMGAVGDAVRGTFSGLAYGTNGEEYTVEGMFRILLDAELTSASISGIAWEDTNENGLRDNGEPPVSGVSFLLDAQDSNISLNVSGALTDASGEYTIDGIVPGFEYKVRVDYLDARPLTFQDVGNDDSIDNDFAADFSSDVISLGDGQELQSLDAGYRPIKPLECNLDASSCEFIEVQVSGGVPPYSYQIETPSGQIVTDGSYYIDEEGTYSVTVTDDQNTQCMDDEYAVLGVLSFWGVVWVDQAGGTDGLYDSDVDLLLENVNVSLVDDQGNTYISSQTFSNGSYFLDLFGSLSWINDLRVRVELPSGYEFVNQSANGSNVDSMSGLSDPYAIFPCDNVSYEVNAGLREL